MKIKILGTRGIPARHGGFETFAERLAIYLISRGWEVTVYCQTREDGRAPREDLWNGINRVFIPIYRDGAFGTILFDWKATVHACRDRAPVLLLGYNTAVFSILHRLVGIPNIINMDGIEWRRAKWTLLQRAWLYTNERFACLLGDHLVADHPEIKRHLSSRTRTNKITMIPYGADEVVHASRHPLEDMGLEPDRYVLMIGRPEPENSILEIVRAYSHRRRGMPLVVLGEYRPSHNPYHHKVLSVAGPEVQFHGAIYRKATVEALRFYCRLHIHGHTVGGTNPSLVEALGAGSPVLAHDNVFNRWVAGPGSHYFKDENECAAEFDDLLNDDAELERMKSDSKRRHLEDFSWKTVLEKYEFLLGCFAKTGG
jgi:glycosyltransferase involved in cell wall biosynthesis